MKGKMIRVSGSSYYFPLIAGFQLFSTQPWLTEPTMCSMHPYSVYHQSGSSSDYYRSSPGYAQNTCTFILLPNSIEDPFQWTHVINEDHAGLLLGSSKFGFTCFDICRSYARCTHGSCMGQSLYVFERGAAAGIRTRKGNCECRSVEISGVTSGTNPEIWKDFERRSERAE